MCLGKWINSLDFFSLCFYLYFLSLCHFYSTVFLLVSSSEMQLIAFLAGKIASHQLAVAKSLKILAIPIFFATGFDSGVVFVTLYSFLMLILCDQLLILITTFHRCFLSKENLPGNWPFCPYFVFSSFPPPLSYTPPVHANAQHSCSDCDQKKVTPYRNFFRHLNFKNIVKFF